MTATPQRRKVTLLHGLLVSGFSAGAMGTTGCTFAAESLPRALLSAGRSAATAANAEPCGICARASSDGKVSKASSAGGLTTKTF
mmetsp:Transcript_151346/g.384702  ORF Transcript_151346/g.384702 Transcript_151346/m.384702 type:complete len:85 (-) Transcript_151346:604-858(-)